MRKAVMFVLTAGVLAACESSTAPDASDLSLTNDILAASISLGMPDRVPGRALHEIGRLHNLPADLALTAAQESSINALIEKFTADHKADLDALAAILKRVHDAMHARASREDVKKILAEGDPIRARLATAEAALRTQIDAVLTAAQKDWLAANPRERCNVNTTPLTDAQKSQINTLIASFNTASAADLAAVKKAHEDAEAAHKAGKSRAEVQAILDAVKPAQERLQAAGDKLRAAIDAVLTPEQRASNCFNHGVRKPRRPNGPGQPGSR